MAPFDFFAFQFTPFQLVGYLSHLFLDLLRFAVQRQPVKLAIRIQINQAIQPFLMSLVFCSSPAVAEVVVMLQTRPQARSGKVMWE